MKYLEKMRLFMTPNVVSRIALSKEMRNIKSSIRVFDAGGNLTLKKCHEIKQSYMTYGALHVTNTGFDSLNDFIKFMPDLGFGKDQQFLTGGRTSNSVQKKWVVPGLRNMDNYPKALWLPTNNEIQYQKNSPKYVIFYCNRAPKKESGGRSFIHSAKAVENYILSFGEEGEEIITQIKQHGLTIETGFLDATHPLKKNNYFQSWQERFGSISKEEAMKKCKSLPDEYDECWWKKENIPADDGSETYTLMTRITLPAYKIQDGIHHLRFPRIALDGPSLQNGYRKFTLGNGSELTTRQNEIVTEAYISTLEGTHWSDHDFIIFDNVSYGHSRESFDDANRSILVGMAGSVWVDNQSLSDNQSTLLTTHSFSKRFSNDMPYSREVYSPEEVRYVFSPNPVMWNQTYSMRTFDANKELSCDTISAISHEFKIYGALHIINTGLNLAQSGIPEPILNGLGFAENELFQWGGLVSGRTNRDPLAKNVSQVDYYPNHLFLLPHNEILYQRFMPERLLFQYHQPSTYGGRTFVHNAKQVERYIFESGKVGQELLHKLNTFGFSIETGFLDENHPYYNKNYLRSWQNRSGTLDRGEALEVFKHSKYQFDECYWKKEEATDLNGNALYTLMTKVTIPAFKFDPRNNESYLFFPRIALNGPMTVNGYRRFPLGNGEELSKEEIDIILQAYYLSLEGRFPQANDLLLVDNIRYGHSREAFPIDNASAKRIVGVSMAGGFHTDDVDVSQKQARINKNKLSKNYDRNNRNNFFKTYKSEAMHQTEAGNRPTAKL